MAKTKKANVKSNEKENKKQSKQKNVKKETKNKKTAVKEVKKEEVKKEEVKNVKLVEEVVEEVKKEETVKVKTSVVERSKEYNKADLFKWIGGLFLLLVVLTWFVKSGNLSSGNFTLGETEPLGLLDLVRIPLSTFTSYFTYGLLILVIGGLYCVTEKTGAYDELVNRFAKKNKKRPKLFLAITVLLLSTLSAVTGLQWILLILVPFFIDVLRKLDYSRLSGLMATIGSILIGNLACIYGFNVCGYLNYYIGLDLNKDVFTKIILFVMLVTLLILYIIKNNKKELNTNELEVSEEVVENKEKRSVWPLVAIVLFTFVFLLIAGYNWYYGVGFEGFVNLYNNIDKDYSWVNNVIGQTSPLGYWGITEATMLIILAAGLIAWVYSLTMKETFNAFVEGCKRALMPAVYVSLASVVTYAVLGASSGNNIYYTISNSILGLSENVHVLVMSLFSFVSGLFINDFTYFVGYTYSTLKAVYTNAEMYSFMALMMQVMHGFVMLIVPTSAILVSGLAMLKVNFLDYIKYVWKFLLQVFVVCMIVFVAIAMFM